MRQSSEQSIWQRLASFVWPLTTRVESDKNGPLEITWINGRKVLDSKHTNYSYGSLQRVLEEGISRIDLQNAKSVLVLGLGGGSIIHSLRSKFGYEGMVHAVEFDNKIIAIAGKEFRIWPNDRLKIHHADAFEFVRQCSSTHDLVVVDLFIDRVIPAPFLSDTFCNDLTKCLAPGGGILFNLGLDVNKADQPYRVADFFRNQPLFDSLIMEQVQGRNLLVIAKSRQ